MKGTSVRNFIVVMVGILCGALWHVSAQAASDAPIVLKFAHQNPHNHPYQMGAEKFKSLVESKSKNKVSVELFHSGQLGNERELIEQLSFGSLDFIVSASAPFANFIPDMMVFDLPFIFRDRPHAYAVLDGPIGQKIAAKLSNEGIMGLGFWENGFRHVSNSRNEVKTPADLKGLKIRLMENPIHLGTFAAMGALPTPMAWPEVFTALQQKTIDGMENSPVIYVTANLFEVQKYYSLTGHFYSPAVFAANEKKFKSLPADIQAIILESAQQAKAFERAEHERLDNENLGVLKTKGMIITEVNKQPFRDACNALYATYAKKLNAAEVIDAIIAVK